MVTCRCVAIPPPIRMPAIPPIMTLTPTPPPPTDAVALSQAKTRNPSFVRMGSVLLAKRIVSAIHHFNLRLKLDTELFTHALLCERHQVQHLGGGGPTQVHHEVGVLRRELRLPKSLAFQPNLLDQISRRVAGRVLESRSRALALR